MKKYILPLAAGFALGLSGAAMAGNVGSDHGKVAAQDHSIVATVSGPQLMTDAQLDSVVAGSVDLTNNIGGTSQNVPTPVFSGYATLSDGPSVDCSITFNSTYTYTC